MRPSELLAPATETLERSERQPLGDMCPERPRHENRGDFGSLRPVFTLVGGNGERLIFRATKMPYLKVISLHDFVRPSLGPKRIRYRGRRMPSFFHGLYRNA